MLTVRSPRRASLRNAGLELAAAALLTSVLLGATTVASAHLSQKIALVAPAVLVACLFLVFNPRVEISLAIVALYLGLLDGYLKLSTGSQLATSARDLLLYAIVAGSLLRLAISSPSIRLPKYTAHVLLLVGVVVAQALNPGTYGVKAVVGGMRQHLEFVPLMFFGYAVMRSERRLKVFLLILLAIVVANSIVALVQYNMTPQDLAAWGPGYSQRVLGTGAFQGAGRVFSDASGSHIRPFALGSDSGVSGVLGWIALAGALALVAGRSGLRLMLCGALGVIFCVIGVVASQSRSTVIAGVVVVVAFAALSVTSREATRGLVTLLIGGLLIYVGLTTFVSHHHRDSASRLDSLQTSSLQHTIAESRGNSASLIPQYAFKYPLGVGLARAGPAIGFGGATSGLNAENEPNFLIGELGTVGLVIFASLWLRVLFDGIRAVRQTTAPATRLYLAALVAPLGAMTVVWFASTPTTGPPTAPFFWFVAGIIAWAVTAGSAAFVADHPRRAEAEAST